MAVLSIGRLKLKDCGHRPAGLAVVLAGILFSGMWVGVAVRETQASLSSEAAQGAEFKIVGTHPRAIEQSTAIGRSVATLFAWRGRLYAGYGDYGANTGPISISPYDPVTGEFTEVWESDTEAIYNYRAIGDQLYAPAIDRRSRADYAAGEPWSDHGSIVTTHAYDIVTVDGSDLWLVGSKGYAAAAWRSTDGGDTWQQELAVEALSGEAEDFARFYFAGAFDGRLYLQAIDYPGGQHPSSLVYESGSWSEGPDLLVGLGTGWRPVEFADWLVYSSSQTVGTLLAFDGQAPTILIDWYVYDTATDGRLFYVLAWHVDASTGARGALSILRTADLWHWYEMAPYAPDDSSSLAVMGEEIYLGTEYADLWRLDGEPLWRAVEVPPFVWRAMLPHVGRTAQ